MSRYSRAALTLVAGLLFFAAVAAAQAGRITATEIADQFGGQGIDTGIWWYGTNDANVSIGQGRGRITVDVGAAAADWFNASIGTRCKVHGNFDARLSHELVNGPATTASTSA